MKEYENISNEEIRIQDYKAACGLFGSKIAQLGIELGVEPKNKLRPYEYGVKFQKAIASFIERHASKQEYDKFNGLLGTSVPLASAFRMQNEKKDRISGRIRSPSKKQFTKIIVVGSEVNFNLVLKVDSTVKEDQQSSQSDSKSTRRTKTMKESRKETKREVKPYLKSEQVSSPAQHIKPTDSKRYDPGFDTGHGNSSKRNRKY